MREQIPGVEGEEGRGVAESECQTFSSSSRRSKACLSPGWQGSEDGARGGLILSLRGDLSHASSTLDIQDLCKIQIFFPSSKKLRDQATAGPKLVASAISSSTRNKFLPPEVD